MADRSVHGRLERVRDIRRRKQPDHSLAFLKPYFQYQVARPHKQMAGIIDLWRQLVPPELLAHTRLESLTRSVLRVGVDSSAHLYALDRLLRSGLEDRLRRDAKATKLRRVHLKLVGPQVDQ